MRLRTLVLPSLIFLFSLGAPALTSAGQADLPGGGTFAVSLHDPDSGESRLIGELTLGPRDAASVAVGGLTLAQRSAGHTFEFRLDDAGFRDEFLSMRPFKCLQGAALMMCRLVYPYEKPDRIADGDLRALEYEFLFLYKSPEEYGIDAWNGLFYRLTPVEGGFDGELHEVDLNVLAAPPEDDEPWPVTYDQLHPAEVGKFPWPMLRIRAREVARK